MTENQKNTFEKSEYRPPLLADICWTLFYSNTTMDFLDFAIKDKSYIRFRKFSKVAVVRFANLLFFKLFGKDLLRYKCVSYLKGMSRENIEDKVKRFYDDYLSQRKIRPVWNLLKNRDLVPVSATLDVVAEQVAYNLNAKKFFASKLLFEDGICQGRISDDLLESKSYALSEFADFDIVTDNLTDIQLVKKAGIKYIVLYKNKSRWLKELGDSKNVVFIETNGTRY